MPVTVIVGGQFGSEGKGKVAHILAKEMGATVAIRVGGPNSGHTAIGPSGDPVIFKQLPTAALLPDVVCVLPAGSYINPEILREEIRLSGLDSSRLVIAPQAVVITEREIAAEHESNLGRCIGSTQSGTGAAVLARLGRCGGVNFASDHEKLRPYVKPVTPFLRARLSKGERVIIEGTQGFGLSIFHTPQYPYATSRDTTAASFVTEAGLSPLDIDDVVMVIRAFPIRVPGNSGPLPAEMTWDELTQNSRSPEPLSEFTSVTRQKRRVAKFDPDIVLRAIEHNQPTRIILNHLDYVDAECTALNQVTPKAKAFLESVQRSIGRPIDYIGYGRSHLTPPSRVPVRKLG